MECGKQNSNLHPSDYQSEAQPFELFPHLLN
jgi:hypothetical protein